MQQARWHPTTPPRAGPLATPTNHHTWNAAQAPPAITKFCYVGALFRLIDYGAYLEDSTVSPE